MQQGRVGSDPARREDSLPAETFTSLGHTDWKRESHFITLILICSLLFQRFGVPFGSTAVNIAGPIALATCAYFLYVHVLRIELSRLIIFLGMLCCTMLGYTLSLGGMVPFNAQFNLPSVIQFLAITFFAVFRFARPVPEEWFFRKVSVFFAFIAVCGIIQFFIQFAGVSIFSFADYLPSSMLFEKGWNLVIPSGIGELNKSNGFWLIEPSTTSQVMAMAIIIEVLYMRRAFYLALFGLEFVLSFSGTGGIVLASFIVSLAARLGLRGLALALLLVLVVGFLAVTTAMIYPDITNVMLSRLDEFNTPGSSGFDRFVTPFWLISDVWSQFPSAILTGIGGGASERLSMAYEYTVNTPIKITIEYGLPALMLYTAYFLTATRTVRQSVLVLPGLVLMMLTGSYLQFAPVITLISLLLCVAFFPQGETTSKH